MYLDVGVFPLVLHLYTSPLVERHREITVDRGGAAVFVIVHGSDRDGERQGLEVGRHRMTDAEEVTKRGEHRGLLLIVPVHFKDDFAIAVELIW